MAFEDLGLSFLPQDNQGASGPGGARLEDVLRVLSFRLPRILGAKPIAPAQLLNARGGQGDPLGSAVAQGVISQVLRGSPAGSSTSTALGMSGDMGAPSPLSQLFAPALGPGAGIDDIPMMPPRVIPVEGPPSGPGGGGTLQQSYDGIRQQLTEGRMRRG